MSPRTKQCKTLSFIFGLLHFLCLFGPLLYFVPYGLAIGTVVQKVTLSLSIIVSICLAVFSIIAEASTRGGLAKVIMWALVMGVCICLTEVKTFIYIMAIVSIIDELIISKVHSHYKTAYQTNLEIDKRG